MRRIVIQVLPQLHCLPDLHRSKFVLVQTFLELLETSQGRGKANPQHHFRLQQISCAEYNREVVFQSPCSICELISWGCVVVVILSLQTMVENHGPYLVLAASLSDVRYLAVGVSVAEMEMEILAVMNHTVLPMAVLEQAEGSRFHASSLFHDRERAAFSAACVVSSFCSSCPSLFRFPLVVVGGGGGGAVGAVATTDC